MVFVKGFKHSQATIEKFRKRRGELSGSWKGGRYLSVKGYRYIYSPNHPFATSDGYVFEHRLIMEKVLGRYLVPNIDDVHHINGNKLDNRIVNLQLLRHGKHTILTNTKDFSNVKCNICSESKTYTKRNGRPMWYHDGDKKREDNFVCKRCYDRLRKTTLLKCAVS